LKDAVNILSNQLGDTQLAIAVARVYEGDNGPVLAEFLTEKVLPQAAEEGNRWLATWALWMLGKRDKAVRALIVSLSIFHSHQTIETNRYTKSPLSSVISPPETPNLQSKSFLTDDPALIVLYKQLREKSLQTLRGALSLSPRAEWDFILHTAGLYERMGCDLLALDLVKTWEFLTPPAHAPASPSRSKILEGGPVKSVLFLGQPPSALDGFEIDPRKVLRRRSSLVVADLPILTHVNREGHESAIVEGGDERDSEDESDGGKDVVEKKKPQPTQFKEPDANSLLDSFGF
jgi:hypothetical protein